MRKVSKIKLSTDLDLINSIQNPHIVKTSVFCGLSRVVLCNNSHCLNPSSS